MRRANKNLGVSNRQSGESAHRRVRQASLIVRPDGPFANCRRGRKHHSPLSPVLHRSTWIVYDSPANVANSYLVLSGEEEINVL